MKVLEDRPHRHVGTLGHADHRGSHAGLGDHRLGRRDDLAPRFRRAPIAPVSPHHGISCLCRHGVAARHNNRYIRHLDFLIGVKANGSQRPRPSPIGRRADKRRLRQEQGKDRRTMLNTSHALPPQAVLWDFGGVILTSPFEAFRTYEREAGLPEDFIRMLNARNPDANAWAKMERSEVGLAEFVALFEAEAAAHGHKLDGWRVLKAISGDIRPQMVEALRRCKASFRVACITNNMKHGEGPGMARSPEKAAAVAEVMTLFEHVVESSKLGFRKPDPRIYQHACELIGVPPERCVYLDDLGINLKPAKALGMRTIKVGDPDVAIAELEAIVGIPLKG